MGRMRRMVVLGSVGTLLLDPAPSSPWLEVAGLMVMTRGGGGVGRRRHQLGCRLDTDLTRSSGVLELLTVGSMLPRSSLLLESCRQNLRSLKSVKPRDLGTEVSSREGWMMMPPYEDADVVITPTAGVTTAASLELGLGSGPRTSSSSLS